MLMNDADGPLFMEDKYEGADETMNSAQDQPHPQRGEEA
jgi:hypothetical protein